MPPSANSVPADPAPTRTSRRWASSNHTRRLILDAACDVFRDVGYAQATVEEIVARSGVSVGSIYHHVGNKSALFSAVALETLVEQAQGAGAAVQEAREGGEADPVELYLIGARAYLMKSWHQRHVTRIILSDDRPAGFTETECEAFSQMVADTKVVPIGNDPLPGTSSAVVVALLKAASEQLTLVEDETVAARIADYFVGLIRRLSTDGPAAA